MIKKRTGEIIVTNHKQNELLKKLYDTAYGRCLLKVLTLPAVSKAAGLYMAENCLIPRNDLFRLSDLLPDIFPSCGSDEERVREASAKASEVQADTATGSETMDVDHSSVTTMTKAEILNFIAEEGRHYIFHLYTADESE